MLPLALAATLHDPPGDLVADTRRAIPLLRARYGRIAVTTSPTTSAKLVAVLRDAGMYAGTPRANRRGPLYRLALRRALGRGIERVHYLDFDRVLHWLWVAPRELDRVLRLDGSVLIGRTPKAHRSHQRPLHATEAIVNRLFVEHLGWTGRVDFMVPSFVLPAAEAREFLRRSRALDENFYGEWAALLATVPSTLRYVECRGLEWETPDRDRAGVRRQGLDRWRTRFETPAEWGLRLGMSAAFMRGFEKTLARSRRRARLRRR